MTNGYILSKVILQIFPYRPKDWIVVLPDTGAISSPDLYIPMMSFFTYILMKGIHLGFDGKFRPEALSIIATRALFIDVTLLGLFKVIGYFIEVQELSLLDVVSFIGYKYLTLSILMIKIRLLSAVLVPYMNVSLFVFLIRGMRAIVLNDKPQKKKRIYFMAVFCLSQVTLVVLYCTLF